MSQLTDTELKQAGGKLLTYEHMIQNIEERFPYFELDME